MEGQQGPSQPEPRPQEALPTFTLGSAEGAEEGGLRVFFSCTVALVALQQGQGSGGGSGGSKRTAAAAAAEDVQAEEGVEGSAGSGLRAALAQAATGFTKPLGPLRYLLHLSADALQLFRPAEGREESCSEEGQGESASPGGGAAAGEGVGASLAKAVSAGVGAG